MRVNDFVLAALFWVLATGALAAETPLLSKLPIGKPLTAAGELAQGESARPWVFWFWINGNIGKEGITAALPRAEDFGGPACLYDRWS